MEDAEAEAVLLALGEPLALEWKICLGVASGVSQSACIDAEIMNWYEIGHGLFFLASFKIYLDCVDASPVSFISLAAAKAACERHHATGKWE